MTDEDRIPTEVDESRGRDRRRERRVEFVAPCRVSVIAPPWAMTTRPLDGETQDITLHGARVSFPGFDRQTADNWADAIRSDVEMKVSLELAKPDGFGAIKGQAVWVHHEMEEEGEPGRCLCSIGILFSVLREREAEKLMKLIDSTS